MSKFITQFFVSGSFDPNIKTLIPKVSNPFTIEDYKLINMVEFLYKIIAKILANMVKSVMGDIIRQSQTGFIQDIHIIDGLITTIESFAWLKRKKKMVALCKLDFRNAYDSVR